MCSTLFRRIEVEIIIITLKKKLHISQNGASIKESIKEELQRRKDQHDLDPKFVGPESRVV